MVLVCWTLCDGNKTCPDDIYKLNMTVIISNLMYENEKFSMSVKLVASFILYYSICIRIWVFHIGQQDQYIPHKTGLGHHDV